MSARSRAGLVYFMKPARMDGPIKIGFSWCPANRLIELSTWSPWPLELIGFVSAKSSDETFLHKCFADLHSHREWFRSAPRLRETINEILQAGSIDAVRSKISPIGSIKSPRPKSPGRTRLRSYRMKIYWALRKLDKTECYWSMPKQVSEIMDHWHGNGWRRLPQREPTADEIAILDAFIANPAATAVRHERKLKVVA